MKKTRDKKSHSFPDYDDYEDLKLTPLSGGQTAAQVARDAYQQMYASLNQQIMSSFRPSMMMISASALGEELAEKPPSVDAAKLEALKTTEPHRVQKRMPDFMEVITAWRGWRIEWTDDGLRLKALGQDTIWQPKKQVEAICAKSDSPFMAAFSLSRTIQITPKHPAPQMTCQCGVWAFKEIDSLVAAIGTDYSDVRVLGQVSLWGRVIETENGYRAEKAYPSELWLLDNSLEELGLIYDVPVRSVV